MQLRCQEGRSHKLLYRIGLSSTAEGLGWGISRTSGEVTRGPPRAKALDFIRDERYNPPHPWNQFLGALTQRAALDGANAFAVKLGAS